MRVKIVMGNQGIYVIGKKLKTLNGFFQGDLPDVSPLDAGEFYFNGEGNESVEEGGDNSNNDSSTSVHVDIPEYQVQSINANKIKENITKKNPLQETNFLLMKYF